MPPQPNHLASPNRPRNGSHGGSSRGLVDQEVKASTTAEQSQTPEPDMTGQLGNLGADLIHLSELQLELLAVDARDASRQAFYPTLITFLAAGFLIGSCPLGLLGLSWWLTENSSLSLAASSLLIATVGLLFAGVLFFLAWKGFKSSFALLNRSRTELHSNLQWIKKLLSEKHRQRRWPLR
jgi:hypothetical protein